MNGFITRDGVRLHYKDWGSGPPVVFSHGWPLDGDSWESQMLSLAARGHRCIAHDRRGHGRSEQPWDGNDMDGFADDLAELIERLDLHDATLVGFSMGGGEVARYVGRHGTGRIARLVLVAAVPPLMLLTADNPGGTPLAAFDAIRDACLADRSGFYRTLAGGPFFGANRPGAAVPPGAIDAFWLQAMRSSHRSAFQCIAAFSATDFSADLARFDRPTLLIHGDDDQIVPLAASAARAATLIAGARLEVYRGAPHGLTVTHRERFDADLSAFLRA